MMEDCSKCLGSNVNKHHRSHSLALPLKKNPHLATSDSLETLWLGEVGCAPPISHLSNFCYLIVPVVFGLTGSPRYCSLLWKFTSFLAGVLISKL